MAGDRGDAGMELAAGVHAAVDSGIADDVIWNDRRDGKFVGVVHNTKTGVERVLPAAIICLSPDGKSAVFPISAAERLPSWLRIRGGARSELRPAGSGGCGDLAPRRGVRADPATDSFSEAARVPYPAGYSKAAKHWFNHLLYNTDGSRFIFLHRWRGPEDKTFSTRMFTAGADGKNLYVLDPHGRTSHFIWRDREYVLAWAWHPSLGQERFFLYKDRSDEVSAVAPEVMTVNGHCTYLPGGRYILNDTYPDKDRNQNVYLYEIATGKRKPLGSFRSPQEYTGEWRCDTHPRYSPDGGRVCIDSAHAGGRQMYLLTGPWLEIRG